jgi:hypothetical protein
LIPDIGSVINEPMNKRETISQERALAFALSKARSDETVLVRKS